MAIRKACVIVCCMVMASVVQAGISGQFVDRKGVKCKYYEKRYGGGGKGPRGMVVNCGKSYSCEYKGNPHSCKWYNNGHQAEFYKCLVKDLTNAQDACSAGMIACPKKCHDVDMIRVQDSSLLLKILNQVLETYDETYGDRYDDSYDSFY